MMIPSSEQGENLEPPQASAISDHSTGLRQSTPQKVDASDSASPSEWQRPNPGELENGKENENGRTTGKDSNLVCQKLANTNKRVETDGSLH
jgi:hypothetical protein